MDERQRLWEFQRDLDAQNYRASRYAQYTLVLTLTFLAAASSFLLLRPDSLTTTTRIVLYGVVSAAAVSTAFLYLQFQRSKARLPAPWDPEVRWRQERLEAELEGIRAHFTRAAASTGTLEAAERAEIVKELRLSVATEASAEILEELRAKIREESGQAELGERFNFTARRLKEEIQALTGRANLNLLLGIVITLVGIGVLWYTVYTVTVDYSSMTNVLGHYAPRFSVVLLIEIFAYFFLRLYKSSLAEIKYYQNELTNFESRFLALILALRRNDSDTMGKAILQLAMTERNFVLTAGQTTVELEREKLQHDALVRVSEAVKEAFQRKSK